MRNSRHRNGGIVHDGYVFHAALRGASIGRRAAATAIIDPVPISVIVARCPPDDMTAGGGGLDRSARHVAQTTGVSE